MWNASKVYLEALQAIEEEGVLKKDIIESVNFAVPLELPQVRYKRNFLLPIPSQWVHHHERIKEQSKRHSQPVWNYGEY